MVVYEEENEYTQQFVLKLVLRLNFEPFGDSQMSFGTLRVHSMGFGSSGTSLAASINMFHEGQCETVEMIT